MDITALRSAILLYSENFETGFEDSIDGFIQAAEQRIYNIAKLPSSNRNQTASLTPSNRYLSLPVGVVAINEVEVKVAGVTTFLLSKDVSFLRESYPDPSVTGVPKFYAMFDDNTLLLAPTPGSAYEVELHFFGYPESIVTAGTTWLGDNYDQTLLYGALIEAGGFMKETPEQMAFWTGQFDSAMSLLMTNVNIKNNTDMYRTGR